MASVGATNRKKKKKQYAEVWDFLVQDKNKVPNNARFSVEKSNCRKELVLNLSIPDVAWLYFPGG